MPFPICLLMILSLLMQHLSVLRIERSHLYLCHNFLLKGYYLISLIKIHSNFYPFVHNVLLNRETLIFNSYQQGGELRWRAFFVSLHFVCYTSWFMVISFRYPNLLPYCSALEMEELSQECNDFVMLEEADIPSAVREEAKAETSDGRYRADVIWNFIHCMKRPDGQSQFPRLSKIALLVLTIPHSNASEERVFSLIRKNKTAFRPNLDPNETLGSIVTVKMELQNGSRASKYEFPPTVLSSAKKATIVV